MTYLLLFPLCFSFFLSINHLSWRVVDSQSFNERIRCCFQAGCYFEMMAKAVLVKPNVAALCMLGSRWTFSCLREVAVTLTMRKNHLSSDQLLLVLRKGPLSSFHDYPILHHRRDFCIRASTDSIGSSLIESMEKKIKEQLTADSVVVKDAYGDGRHVSINVISSAFEGKSAVNRQRMVYKAIWEELQDIVHAVDQMTTLTPSEAAGK